VTALIVALGGLDNVKTVEARSTRLLIDVKDAGGMKEDAFGSLGLRGMVKTGPGRLQVLIGPEADAVAKALSRQVEESA
jgi:PTS system N-acetylglucosamine-specific IIC component